MTMRLCFEPCPGSDDSWCIAPAGHYPGTPHDYRSTADVVLEVPVGEFVDIGEGCGFEFGPEDPHCVLCGARPPADAAVIIMVSDPRGPLCATCAEERDRAKPGP
jgi:hypothetical protein